LETKPSSKGVLTIFLAENVLTRTTTFSSGSIYINIGSETEPKFMRVMNCLSKYPMHFEYVLTDGDHILLKVQHDGEWTDFYFQTYTEALRFQEFLKYPVLQVSDVDPNPSAQSSASKSEKPAQDLPLIGWDEHLSKKVFSEENIDRAIDVCFEAYMHLDLSEGASKSAEEQLAEWKLSVKWYNEVTRRLQRQEASVEQQSVFRSNFARSMKAFFVSTWNKNYTSLSYRECGHLHAAVSDIQKHSQVFSSLPSLSTPLFSLLSSIIFTIESRFVDSFAAGIKQTLQTLLSKDSFILVGANIAAQNALELVRLLSSLAAQVEVLDESAQTELLRGVCAV
jgi:hypothetical protein